jgi:hypothetical protein
VVGVGGTVVVVVVVVGGTVVAVTSTTGASAIVTGTARTPGRFVPCPGWETRPPPEDAGEPAPGDGAGVAEASPVPCRATRGATSRAAQSTNATA